jgi:DNA ligase-1
MQKLIKPMKALAVEKVKPAALTHNLQNYYASGKIDGHRCTIQVNPDTGQPSAYSNSLKLHPNTHVQRQLSRWEYVGFDGELVVNGNFHAASGELRRKTGKPNFTFWVFDYLSLDEPFGRRYARLVNTFSLFNRDNVKLLDQYKVSGSLELLQLNDHFVAKGFEGVCLRNPVTTYKQGRAGSVRPECIKIKELKELECTIVGWKPLEHKHNIKKISEMGTSKRSSHANGKEVDESRLGAFRVISPEFNKTFWVGSGFTDEQRTSFASSLKDGGMVGSQITIKYQPYGSTENRPRIGIFVKL